MQFPDKIFFIKISLKFAPKDLFDNNAALVQVMTWHQTDINQLPEPMLTKFYDTTSMDHNQSIRPNGRLLKKSFQKKILFRLSSSVQSGTKPNLLANILATNFGNLWA